MTKRKDLGTVPPFVTAGGPGRTDAMACSRN